MDDPATILSLPSATAGNEPRTGSAGLDGRPGLAEFERRPGVSALEPADVERIVADLGQPPYRARQVMDAVWRSSAASWDEVTTLSQTFRGALAGRLRFDTLVATDVQPADGGATEKALHVLSDGRSIESVLMRYPAREGRRERATLCISSQAGCAVGCPFCATGELGFDRDLDAAEIVDQVRHASRRLAAVGGHLTNLVFMGMGEPLLNLDVVIEAIRVLTDPARFGLGARHLTISTSGVVPGIHRLAELAPQWTLAVSLHAARDPLRDLLVPLNRRWPVREVVEAATDYGRRTGRRVSYEYILVDGINDTDADAAALVGLLAGRAAHVNCIPMNPVAHTPWRASRPERAAAFVDALQRGGIGVTIRRNRGQEVGAACGQLAAQRGGGPAPEAVVRRRERLEAASALALAGRRSDPEPSWPDAPDPRPASGALRRPPAPHSAGRRQAAPDAGRSAPSDRSAPSHRSAPGAGRSARSGRTR